MPSSPSTNTTSTRAGGPKGVGSSYSNTNASQSQNITGKSILNQRAALVSAYNELGKELSSTRLKAVGNYTLGRTIGEGTFGKVRIGTHRLTGTRVAIKQVPKSHSASLTREIHHHRRLHHANVMKLYEVLATESNIWMISELCLGGELYDYLVERGVLPEPEARRIFGQLCLALAYIHGRGIVHRDLKLENVLLDERCNVKLGDFGFTREFEGKRLMETFCGTTGYAAPEMLAGKKYTGEEVDIWSLGIILYALLCGSLPFDDDDESVMKAKILSGEFELPHHLSDEARDLVSGILKLDPTKRLSIRAILAHPWFNKLMVATPMSTVEEDSIASDSYFPQQTPRGDDDNDQSASEPVATQTPPPNLLGLGVDLGPLSDAHASTTLAAPPVSDSESSDHQSSVSGTTDPTSVEDSKLSEGGSADNSGGDSAGLATAKEASSSSEDEGEGGTKVPGALPVDDATTDSADGQGETPSDDATASRRNTVMPSESKRIGMQHRNESQSTIKRNGSSGSEGGLSATPGSLGGLAQSKAGRASLPTHHESVVTGGTNSDAAHTAHESGEEKAGDTDSPQRAFAEIVKTSAPASASTSRSVSGAVSLVKRDSQSSSRGHHRTPSRTKRRSLSSGGLSDHHPPHLATRPVDYLGMLQQSQPVIFSTALEQRLLHQIGDLGMDVGQIVHSILTDACDASAAMWWLLKRKHEEKEETERLLPGTLSSSTHTVALPPSVPHPPVSQSKAGGADYAAPPLPPKDPMRSVSASSSRAFSPGNQLASLDAPTSRSPLSALTDGLPAAAQQSFRRHLDRTAQDKQHPSLAQAFAAADNDVPRRSRETSNQTITASGQSSIAGRAMKSQESITPDSDSLASPRPGKTRRGSVQPVADSDDVRSSPASQSSNTNATSGGKAGRANRNRANSLSLRLSSVLSGGRKDGPGSMLVSSSTVTSPIGGPAPLNEEPPAERERAKSPVVGFFTRRNAGAFGSQKSDLNSSKAPSESPPLSLIGVAGAVTGTDGRPLSPEVGMGPLLRAKLSGEQDKLSSSSSPPPASRARGGSPHSSVVDSSPSKKSTRTTASSSQSSQAYTNQVGASHIPNSNSVDTFTTISTLQSSGAESKDSSGAADPVASGYKGKPKSSFLSTVRTWLGSEEKQSRRKGKKKAGAADPPRSSGSNAALADTSLVARNSSIRNRSAHAPYSTTGSVSKRNSMRGPSNRTLRGSGVSPSVPGSAGAHRRPHGLTLGDLPGGPGLSRPGSMIRRQSAGSITPTGTMYGERVGPSRAPSSSSLYRAPLTGSGLHGRAGSGSSSSSAFRHGPRTGSSSYNHHLHHHYHHGVHGGSSTSSNFGNTSLGAAGSIRGLSARRMSADGGTIVLRKRVSTQRRGRPDSVHSTSSRPASLYDTSVSHARDESMMSASAADEGDPDVTADDQHMLPGPMRANNTTGTGTGTPQRTSMDSAGGRHSPVMHSVFVAHRNRSSYKGPSSNPALLHHHMSRRSSSQHGSEGMSPGVDALQHHEGGPASRPASAASDGPKPSTIGTWRRSWGRPPPSWSGPVDQGPSRSELVSMLSAATRDKSKLRDVFSDRDDDDWEDEDDEPTFSGGLGQLDSTGGNGGAGVGVGGGAPLSSSNGWKASPTIVDSPMKGLSGSGFTSSNMTRNNSGPGGALGRGSANVGDSLLGSRPGGGPGGSPNPGATSVTSPSLLSQSRYAGVRNAFQPPALGRDVAPRMIAVSEEDDDEEEEEEEGGAEDGEQKGEQEQQASDAAQSTAVTPPSSSSRILGRGAHVPPTAFKSGIVEEEEEEE